MVDDEDAYIIELDKFEKMHRHMQTYFNLECRETNKIVSQFEPKKPWIASDYLAFYTNVGWADEFLLPLYFALSRNCMVRDWNVIFWNIHNGVQPSEWLTEWNCYPALKLGYEKSPSELESKMYRESMYHKENSEKYYNHSPLFSCWWTAVLSEDKTWGVNSNLDSNTYIFFTEKHLDVFNQHANRLKALSDSEMIVFEKSETFLSSSSQDLF